MEIVYLMLPTALAMGAAFVAAFIWASRRGQFDDLDTPAIRILFDDAPQGSAQAQKPVEGKKG